MDLLFHGRPDLEHAFVDAYFRAAGDEAGQALLPFYIAYRAAVRAKVEGMVAAEEEVPEAARREAIERARGHWLLTLSQIDVPERRPALVLVGGLPGTGKTTLAEMLGGHAGFEVVSSDRVRKELAGLTAESPAPAAFGHGIYTPAWHDRTYAACLERAERLLFEGKRVIVDASFREAHRRRDFLEVALQWGVRPAFFVCTAAEETVRTRMAARHGGPSDADWEVHRATAAAWEEPVEDPRWTVHRAVTDGSREDVLAAGLTLLREEGLIT
jgi:predicted kinase